MEYRTLGRTGLRVSAVALGCEGFMNRPEEEVRADFDFAIENGINFLDLYASNPELRSSIGAALAGRREGFVIQGHLCSVWEEGQYLRTRDPEKAQAAFDDLLARLGTDYVDIGMIHYVDAEDDLRKVLDGPILQLALRLRSEGRLRHIGISSHNPAVARQAVAIHSSVISLNGGAVLFLGESGTGKSTHTRLWREHIPGAELLNDDSPIVRIVQTADADPICGAVQNPANAPAAAAETPDASAATTGAPKPQAMVFGAPWSGKTPCYRNVCQPIRAIVRLSQAPHNRIRRLRAIEAIGALLPSCPPSFAHDETLEDAVCATVSAVVAQVPVYHLECLPDAAAAELACRTIFGGESANPRP